MQYNNKNYVLKSCYQSSALKYEKLNSNINISKISHLLFDMLCYLLESMMTLALTISEYLQTNRGSEQRTWYNEILLKEK